MNTNNDNLENEIICPCSGTTRAKVRSLFEQGLDINAISRWTGAITGCGGCEWDIEQLVNELSLKQNSNAS